ncbi:hypothetical protein J132_08633 [Termitomyces sp. J132]|nr:hypothetical protein J132_08633 [Termitomyces sp. J132]
MNTNRGSAVPAQGPQTSAEFIPPISAVAANSTSIVTPTSLRTRFPDIEAAVITAIIMHEFKAADLHKLDPTNRDKEVAYTFNGTTNQFEISNRAAKEYKNPFSVIVPLQRYFNVLGFHLPKSNDVPFVFYEYTAHLMELIAEFEWSAVFQYHSVFFNCRRSEMATGDYSGWGIPATDLLSKHVYAYRKAMPGKQPRTAGNMRTSSPTDVCRKYNEGKCTVTPCPWGRPHSCATCGKMGHGKHQHKD